ncbi:1562_t:CDS:2 [Paraglomus occultum]|uniref:1562_t:CDS:1 n=1 Tax=Paraglomus occultum TaxID=144539 RepID=A0A9N9BR78_9GLOM|nr:1562_t:CDS:2 [Paraglomus occultum]
MAELSDIKIRIRYHITIMGNIVSMSLHADEKIKSHASQSMGLTSSISSSQVPQDLPAALLTAQSRPGCRILATTKRAAQNRAAQRAFRQRKDRYIKDLEAKAKELESLKRRLEQAEKEKEEMKSTITTLKAEVAKLKGEAEDDKSRGEINSNSSSSINSPFTPNGSSEDDLNGLGEDPWMRKRKNAFYNERSPPAYQSPPSHPRPSHVDTARPSSTAATTNSSASPTNASNASTSPTNSCHYDLNRNDYRSYPNSPTSDTRRPFSSCVNNAQSRSIVSEDDPAERVMIPDDLCEMLRTRSHPDIHASVGVSFWASRNPAPVVAGNGSNAVVG